MCSRLNVNISFVSRSPLTKLVFKSYSEIVAYSYTPSGTVHIHELLKFCKRNNGLYADIDFLLSFIFFTTFISLQSG